MSAHWPLVSWLPERNFNVFMFDYHGFGKSKGTPSQAGLLDDTQSAINVVRHRSDVNPQRLVLFGQSIGGANILAVIGQGDREGIRAVILDSTFASYATIANQMIPGSGYLLDESYSGENTSPASARSRFYSFTVKLITLSHGSTAKSCIALQKCQNG